MNHWRFALIIPFVGLKKSLFDGDICTGPVDLSKRLENKSQNEPERARKSLLSVNMELKSAC